MTRAIIFLLFISFLDIYCYIGLKKLLPSLKLWLQRSLIAIFYVGISLVLYFMIVVIYDSTIANIRGMTPNVYNFMGALILIYVPKIFIVAILLASDIFHLINWVIILVISKISKNSTNNGVQYTGRRQFITNCAFIIGTIPFFGVLDGLFRGRFNFTIHYHTHTHKDIPTEFDGFKIIQISDLHAQSFWNSNALEKAFTIINKQDADVIVFTGDLVNNLATEVDPIFEQAKGLKAKSGMYAVLGNHDYGDYYKWKSIEDKSNNFKNVKNNYAKMGFQLLNNEAVKIQKGNSLIELIGVENWGVPPFPQRGDLDKAIANCNENTFKILLSHDPSHWRQKVVPNKMKIHLTLSGHTHGMQFGIEIPGFKWSPSKWKYNEWAGLYNKDEEYIYVNRGLGCIGFPGRVGIWPEITSIILKSDKNV